MSANNCVINVERKVLFQLLLRALGHVEKYGVFDLLQDSGYSVRLGYLANICVCDVD